MKSEVKNELKHTQKKQTVMNRRLKLFGFAALVAGFCFGKSLGLMAQEEEPPPMYINIGFYKVDQENRAAYEMLMKDVFGPIMQKRVDE